MDSIDRSYANLPVQFSTPLSLPATMPVVQGELSTPVASSITSQTLLRGLSRHWWRILLLWLLISVPLAYSVYVLVEPTYEAFSTIRIEPVQQEIYNPLKINALETRNISAYLQTQINVIISDKVLEEAIANPLVVNLPTIRQSDDPRAFLRKKLAVDTIDNAYMIRVALELADAQQAATIVNTVVETYMLQNRDFNRSVNKNLQTVLETQLKVVTEQLTEKTKEMQKKVGESKPMVLIHPKINLGSKDESEQSPMAPTFTEVTQEQYSRTVAQIDRVDDELFEAEALLETLDKNAQANPDVDPSQTKQVDERTMARIKDEFNKDSEVVALGREIAEARKHLERVRSAARQNNDPSVYAARKHVDKLEEEWQELWGDKYVEILARLQVGGDGEGTGGPETIKKLRIRIESLKKTKDRYVQNLQVQDVKKSETNSEAFNINMLDRELGSLLGKKEQITKNLEQLKFEAEQENFRVMLQDAASVPKVASNNKRVKYMAAAPVAILFMMVGLFLVLEIRAERVADPDALSARVRSEVFALPPLPTVRSMRKLEGPEADDQIEQFIQRLDHLRFAVCASAGQLGKGRCVLITSAIGGEGKTTLAAQLAARCGNAGMSTLLIDADLRRAALCTLLDVPEGPGLSDVLQDESSVDEVIIPVQGGTFYLLPAGTPIQDASRVLQSRKFELLMTQLRQLYDLIIIDSPPILPVPDALILGKWADGAVLAARYDISRFPQVERARRQLDNAGIAILGTVINGMRHSESYYGRYTYSRRRSSQSDSSSTI
jgi:polysaccharide biosynthesis transport protein